MFFGHNRKCRRVRGINAPDAAGRPRKPKPPPLIPPDGGQQLFPVGRIYTTASARQAMEDMGRHALAYVIRHASGRWPNTLLASAVRKYRKAIQVGKGEVLSIYPL